MKCSLFFEMQSATPRGGGEAQVFHQAVEQAVLADQLGYHGIWAVEHHGLYQYSHSSAPEVFLSFVAARTKRIRLGHGVALLPFAYNHPIRVAERIATLDILSEGRVNFGTGKGASLLEQRAFGLNPSDLTPQWEEALRMIMQMWSAESFEYQSETFSIPKMQILPRPVQQPHPPLFVACTSAGSLKRAGELGLGALNFSFGTQAELAARIAEYRAAIAKAAPIGQQVNSHFACAPAALILPNDKEACRYGFRGAQYFADSLDHYTKNWQPGAALNPRTDFLPDDKLQGAMAFRRRDDNAFNVLCGDPIYAREYISRFAALGVDELILVMQMGTVPPELVLQSVLTFGEQVLPHIA
ncbi:MAG TPA: LLM class flavin-dependent oxidoreductase [Polyangiaceae bacterium]|nr:LLM class flavin-dependent oxidoreductase [Polyangiaceae bacterium]